VYLGLSLALLWGSGVLGARLLQLRSIWDRMLAAAALSLAEVVLLSLAIGLWSGGYRPLPLTVGTAAVFVVLLAASIRTGRIVTPPLEPEDRPYLKAMLLVILLTLPIWLWILFNGLVLPPVYWDELYYHLVAPAIWAREGQVHFFATSNPFVAGYPANLDMLWGWTMVMTGTDVWADLGGLPFVFMGLVAVLAFCRRLGLQARYAFWGGLLFVTTPVVIWHAKASYIDLPMAALFGVAAYFLYSFATEGSRRSLLPGAVTMGLMVGAKYSGPYLVVAGLLPILYYMWTALIRRVSWVQAALWYGLPILLIGGFWYGKNLLQFGNPLHPMRLSVAGVTIFDGRYAPDAFTFTKPENSWVTLGKALLDTDPYPLMDSFYSGFGPQLLLLAIPATVLFLMKEKRRRWVIAIAWLLPLFLSVAVLPARYPRYVVHLNLFLLPFAVWLMEDMAKWPRRIVQVICISFVGYCVVIASPIYSVKPNAYPVSVNTIWAAHRVGPGSQAAKIQQLNDEAGRPLRLITGSLRLTYPLLGERWQNDLLYVEPTDEETWLANVKRSGADYAWYEAGWDVLVEAPWVKRHPEVFEPVFTDGTIQIYRIHAGEGGS